MTCEILTYCLAVLVGLNLVYILFREKGWLPKKDVKGKHVYITGAGSGLGRGMALEFAKLKANVTILDVNMDGLVETKNIIKKETGSDSNILAVKLDVTDRTAVSASVKTCTEKYGPVDILINNAGIVQGKMLLDMNEKLMRKVLEVNVESHMWLVRDVLPAMIKQNSGQIVSISSMAGLMGNAFMTDYSASKFAATGFNESLRIEMKYLATNVKTTTIMPYMINTGMFDGAKASWVFPFLEPHYVIRRIVSAILQEEEEITIPWSQGVLVRVVKGLLPVYVTDLSLWLLMGWDFMKGFTGR